MILARETYEKFGHWPENLKNGSCKRILYKCLHCKKSIETAYGDYVRKKFNHCKSCTPTFSGIDARKKHVLKSKNKYYLRKYGLLTGTKNYKIINGTLHWQFRCECSKTCYITPGSMKTRKLCGYTCPMSDKRTGIGEMSGTYWSSVINGAKTRGYEVKITAEDAYELFLSQGGLCKRLKIPLIMKYNNLNFSNTASLDRIDSSKGYIKGNVQWIHKEVNRLKGSLSESQFDNWIDVLYKAKHNRSKS